jgi:indolepyruvate ferredoxin oxidoreductase beta subunit
MPAKNLCPETQFVIAGVGGQGVLFTTRVLARMALDRKLGVLLSETHGMSQRGGSVVSHLKAGSFHSPLVRKGQADVLYVLQAEELYATATFLKPGAKCFLNTGGGFKPNAGLQRYLGTNRISCRFVDADAIAQDLGSLLLANLVLLGCSLAGEALPFTLPGLFMAIKSVSKPAFHQMNLAAAKTGHGFEPSSLNQSMSRELSARGRGAPRRPDPPR